MKQFRDFTCILIIFLFNLSCNSEGVVTNTNDSPQDSVTCIDGDANVYSVVKIGNQYWMAENLKTTRTTNGELLSGVYLYDNNNTNISVYGRLYTWQAAVDAAPNGWHLPTDADWGSLFDYVGGKNNAGRALKETGTTHWDNPNVGATNSAGFNARGSGFRGPDGNYYSLRRHCDFWGTANSGTEPYCIYLYNNSAGVIDESNSNDRSSGIAFSVRYLKN